MKNKKILLILFFLNFLLTFSILSQDVTLSPEEELIKTSLENLKAQKSLRFSILIESRVAGNVIMYSRLEGEGIQPDKSRVKGEVNMIGIQMYVDSIIIGNTQYDKDRITGKWFKKERKEQDEKIERNPFETIRKLTEDGKFKYMGDKKHKDVDVYVYEFIPKVKEDFVKVEEGIKGVILIEKEKNILRKLYLKQSALREDGLTASSLIEIEFYDFDKEIKIEPPEVYTE